MGGALLELVALRKTYSSSWKSTNFIFKNVYKRHTNFSIKSVKNEFLDRGGFGLKNSCIIERKGDLLKNIYLEIELPLLSSGNNISWINGIGNHIIDRVDLLMGGEVIDTLTGEYLDIYSSLVTSQSKQDGYYKMIGKHTSFTNQTQKGSLSLIVPLPFWFTKNIGYALPLVSMQYTDIQVDIFLRPFSQCWYSGSDVTGSPSPSTVQVSEIDLFCDYIFLDTFERTKFAKNEELEYLIEQLQINDKNIIASNQTSFNCELYFNHPVKELIWVYNSDEIKTYNIWGKYGNNPNSSNSAPFTHVELRLNNNDRFEKEKANILD